MGKIRVATLGDDSEKESKRRADARRQTKKSKKEKVEGVGLHGGERVAVVEGGELKPEYKRIVDQVELGETAGEEAKPKKKRKQKLRVRSKRYVEAASLVDKTKDYSLSDAVGLVKKTSLTKFDGTVELHINLNREVIGTGKDKSDFRGSVSLPHGTGKEVRVAIADDKVLSEIEAGNINFDVLVAHPSMMPKLARLAKVLGPKGLMPNPKNGTIGEDTVKIAASLAKGKVNFKTEPDQPLLHMIVGKVSFDDKKLEENIKAVLDAVGRSKIVKVTIAASMGPGIKLAVA